jgi:antitoxin component of MazEF toxin-antitoxin module
MSKTNPGQVKTRYEIITQEDKETGDLLIPLPQPLLDQLGWKEGMNVSFSIDDQGKIYMKQI